MKNQIKSALKEIKEHNRPSGADADHSEESAGIFSNLDSDDGEAYDELHDQTPEAEKKRIHDK